MGMVDGDGGREGELNMPIGYPKSREAEAFFGDFMGLLYKALGNSASLRDPVERMELYLFNPNDPYSGFSRISSLHALWHCLGCLSPTE